jgi:amidase
VRAPRAARAAIDGMLRAIGVDALVAPSLAPAWTTDIVNGDHYVGGGAGGLPAVAGYPHVTVPMGSVGGLPVGLSLFAEAWSEAKLLSFAFAYEQRARARTPPRYLESIATEEPYSAAIRPRGRERQR